MDTKVSRDGPILFTGPMVRGILDGRKFQTRRLVKMRHFGLPRVAWNKPVDGFINAYLRSGPLAGLAKQCPYGQAGDLLWCRETWRPVVDEHLWDSIEYRADGARLKPEVPNENTGFRFSAECDADDGRWRPSIHMPRWASRLRLEITEIRMERLQGITEADAIAEGVELEAIPARPRPSDECLWRDYLQPGLSQPSARRSYESLWESINGEGSWAANPWVWVVGFRRISLDGKAWGFQP